MAPPLPSAPTSPRAKPVSDVPETPIGFRPPPAIYFPRNVSGILLALLALHLTNPVASGQAVPGLWFPAVGVAWCLVAWFGWRAAGLVLLDGLLVAAQVVFLNYFWTTGHSSTDLALIGADALLSTAEVLGAWWLYHVLARGARTPSEPTSATLFLVLIPGVTLGLFALLRALLYRFAGATGAEFGNLLTWFWLSRALGFVAVAPALLAVLTPVLIRHGWTVDEAIDREQATQRDHVGAERYTRSGGLEIGGVALAAGLLSLFLASPFARQELSTWQLGSVPLLLIAWAAARQGVRGGCVVAAASAALPLLFGRDLARGDSFTLLLQATLLAQGVVALLIASSSRYLRFHEARYRQIVGHIPVVIYSARLHSPAADARQPTADVTLVSAASRLLLGCPPDQLVGDHGRWLERVHRDDREVLRAAVAQVVRQDEPVVCEYRLNEPESAYDSTTADGPPRTLGKLPRHAGARWLRDTLAPRRDGAGRTIGWEGVVVDITEQRTVADDLRRTTSLFNALVSNLPAGVFFVQGRRGWPLLINARARQLLGQREDSAANVERLCETYRLELPDGRPFPVDELPVVVALRRGRTTMRDDVVVHRPDGRRVPLVTWGAPVHLGSTPEVQAAVWVLEDRTALQQAEAARHETEMRLRTLLETMGEGLIVLDRQGVVVDCNRAACALVGLTMDQLRGRPWLAVPQTVLREDSSPLPPDERPTQVVLRTRRPLRNQVLGQRAPGDAADTPTRWLLVNCMPLAGDNRTGGVVTTFSDITAYRQAQDGVRASEEKYRGLIEALPCMLFLSDREMRVRYINPATESMTGYRLEEIADVAGWQRVIHPDDLAKMMDVARTALEGTPSRGEFRYRAKDGAERIGYALAQPVRQGGVVTGVTTTVVDLTRQRLLEEKLQRVQRLELIGRLASGIAHDFNNLLNIVMQLTSLAHNHLPANHPVQEELQSISEVSEQAAQLTAQLLAISRQRPVALRRLELNAHVRQSVKLLRSTLPGQIELVERLDEQDLYVNADASQLQQVLMNLCLNARDAMPDGGRLVVETTDCCPPEASGRWAHLAVQDTGQGMTDAVRARIFEPFFTGKERGTGLGLTIVQQVVDGCGGRVEVTSQPNQGARFDVWLPWATEEVQG